MNKEPKKSFKLKTIHVKIIVLIVIIVVVVIIVSVILIKKKIPKKNTNKEVNELIEYCPYGYFLPDDGSECVECSIPNCNECKYARPERIADITIGDYIGLGKDAPFDGITKNTSLVIINSERGEHFWELITATNDIVSFKRDYNKAVPFQPSLNTPFPAHRYTRKLLDLYKEIGFAEASRKILFFDILIRRLKRIVYIFFHLYKIPRKIIQCLVK